MNDTDKKSRTEAMKRLVGDQSVQVGVLVLLALVARLGFLLASGWYGQIINNDAHEYLAIARNLAQGQGFALVDGTPTAFRPFGYPLVLAGIRYLFGDNVAVIQLIQIALGAAVVAPTYSLARQFWSNTVAILSGIGAALHPVLIYLTATISPDLLAVLAGMVALWSVGKVCADGRRRSAYVAVGSIAGALATLMRPEMLMVVWLLPALLIWQARGRGPAIKGVILLAVIATCLAMIPPTIRNWQRFGEFIPMPTIGGVTFWGANNAAANGGWVLPSAANWPDNDPPASMLGWSGLTESENQKRFYEYAWRWLGEQPADALALVPQKLYRSWTISYADEQRAAASYPILFQVNLVFGLLVIVGAVILVRSHRSALWLFAAPVLAWLLKTVIFYGSARQTSTVLPVLIIMAAASLDALWLRLRRCSDDSQSLE